MTDKHSKTNQYALHPAASLLGFDGDGHRSSHLLDDGRICNHLLGISTPVKEAHLGTLNGLPADVCELVAALICTVDGAHTYTVTSAARSDQEPCADWQVEGAALDHYTAESVARIVLQHGPLTDVIIMAPVKEVPGSYQHGKKTPGTLYLLSQWKRPIPAPVNAAVLRLTELGYSLISADRSSPNNPKFRFGRYGRERPDNKIQITVGWYE
jgi:hypothetical protein